jgi:glutamate mutase epsilon subunit
MNTTKQITNRKKEVMIMTKKMTKKEMFTMVAKVVENSNEKNKAEMLEFIAHEVELLEKKNSKSAPTKTQKENEVLKTQVLEALAEFDKPITVTEFMKESTHEVATLSNQKLSRLLNDLVKAEKVIKTIEKKKSFFSLA